MVRWKVSRPNLYLLTTHNESVSTNTVNRFYLSVMKSLLHIIEHIVLNPYRLVTKELQIHEIIMVETRHSFHTAEFYNVHPPNYKTESLLRIQLLSTFLRISLSVVALIFPDPYVVCQTRLTACQCVSNNIYCVSLSAGQQ